MTQPNPDKFHQEQNTTLERSYIWRWCSMCSADASWVVGRAMSNHLYRELMLHALDMALAQRRAYGVIHHSDSKRDGYSSEPPRRNRVVR
jgi:hypothetical protein